MFVRNHCKVCGKGIYTDEKVNTVLCSRKRCKAARVLKVLK